MPCLSEVDGSSLRETRAIVTRKTHPNSASELKINVRSGERIKWSGNELAVGACS